MSTGTPNAPTDHAAEFESVIAELQAVYPDWKRRTEVWSTPPEEYEWHPTPKSTVYVSPKSQVAILTILVDLSAADAHESCRLAPAALLPAIEAVVEVLRKVVAGETPADEPTLTAEEAAAEIEDACRRREMAG